MRHRSAGTGQFGVVGLVSGVAKGLSVGVASSWRDGFGYAVIGDPHLPLVPDPVPGGFDQPVMVVAQQDEIP